MIGAGIVIAGNTASYNLIQSNYIGLDASGLVAMPNGEGVWITNGAQWNTIGGSDAGAGNVISGNRDFGVLIDSVTTQFNYVMGNLIGLVASGNDSLGNGIDGVHIENGAMYNYIGNGDNYEARNTISGNLIGVRITGAGTEGNYVVNNFIGTDVTGMAAVANQSAGVWITAGASYNVIGGSSFGFGASESNLISGNGGSGVVISGSGTTYNTVYGNYIGTDSTGTGSIGNGDHGVYISSSASYNRIGAWGPGGGELLVPLGNTVAFNGKCGVACTSGVGNQFRYNSIFSNGELGIDLGVDGVTTNDLGDGDIGPNNLQNYPIVDFAASDLQMIVGHLNSAPNNIIDIDFFSSETPDSSGFGEGQQYLGSTWVTTDSLGNVDFYQTFSGELVAGQYVTATATDSDGNTSEFSQAVLVEPHSKVFGDHYVVNTTLSGIPLHWHDGSASFKLSTSIPPAFVTAVGNGFMTWSELAPIEYTNDGLTPSTNYDGDPDGINNVVWVSSDWETTTGADTNVVAVTRVRYNAINGEMTDVDMAFDAEHFAWSTIDDTLSPDMNVQNVATHEAGHFSGLGDIYDPGQPNYVPSMGSDNSEVTMFGLIRSGEFKKDDLDTSDVNGINYIYSHIAQNRIDLELVFDGSATFAATYNGFQPSKNSAIELVNKMRIGDRIGVVRMPSTDALPLTEITSQADRDAAVAAINALSIGGSSAVGAGLQAAQSQMSSDGASDHGKAVILFSASEEDTAPQALSVLPSLVSAGTQVFTFGFDGSSGQALSDSIAIATGGAYFLAADTTIGDVVDQIWTQLLGQQLIADTIVSSSSIPSEGQDGIRWQGALVDPGTSEIQPGIRWQGSSFVLKLETPGGIVIDSAYADTSDAIDYFFGPTFAYYRVHNPQSGHWALIVNTRVAPLQPEPVALYVTSSTDVTMSVEFNQRLYSQGSPVVVTADLTRGGSVWGDEHVVGGSAITDATVIAEVTPPGGGTPQQVVLEHQGEGQYRGSFTNTGTVGTYGFRIVGSKPDDFMREYFQSVFVTPPCGIPPVATITGPPSGAIVPVGTPVNFTGTFTDDAGDVHTAMWMLDGTALAGVVNEGTKSITATHTFTTAGVYLVSLTVSDQCSQSSTTNQVDGLDAMVIVYDPSAGFVTGGGWIISPPGAYELDTTLTGKATFGFESKYKKGASAPSGETEFQFKVAKLSFHSTSYDWLVIAGTKAQYKGSGVVNNAGDYGFMLTAVDGQMKKGDGYDRFRIKIWDKSTSAILYDNQRGADDGAMPTTVIGGGSIVIHSSPGSITVPGSTESPIPDRYALSANYPNPFNPTTTIEYALPYDSKVVVKLYNVLGELVEALVDGILPAGYQSVELDARSLSSGVYFYSFEATSVTDQSQSFSQVRKMVLMK